MESAIGCIRRFAPTSWRWLREQQLPIVIDDRIGARYAFLTRIVYLSTDIVMRSTPVPLAMYLVHETRHARVSRLGARMTRRNFDRFEALSFSAERDFVAAFAMLDADGARALGDWVDARQRSHSYEGTMQAREQMLARLTPGWRAVGRIALGITRSLQETPR